METLLDASLKADIDQKAIDTVITQGKNPSAEIKPFERGDRLREPQIAFAKISSAQIIVVY